MRLILIGYGVVAQSLTKILTVRKQEILKRHKMHPRVVAIVDRGGSALNPKGLDLEKVEATKKKYGSVAAIPEYGSPDKTAQDIIENLDAEVVIEATPTNLNSGEPGMSHIEEALKSGKNVVTVNKGPLALALPALSEMATYNDVHLRFGGTVGGGTPILDFGKKCLSFDKLIAIEGILNGSTNYMLTEMEQHGTTFEEALSEAQDKGYAEADPSLDVDGLDAAAKLVIMANWFTDKEVTLKDISIKGIRDIKPENLKEASERGFAIKLIGRIDEELKVGPGELRKSDPLCIGGTLNAVKFQSEFAGDEIIIGKGAGGPETASAILRDLLDIREKM
ncbi:MAG TPA: homoserine dehydrogenase [Nitrososphaerales archaeon]|jgi:homoserine dehydrogenase|nr:homoserine dehydrogenase [Nitrososphaerales archaeon]|tara:strand:- start:5536 stop:6543 length:1008 start_codon:yes stop_codon:yes gene_type:complete